jgi:hypothetical protein
MPPASSGNMTFSRTVFHGGSWSNSWNTTMRSGPARDGRPPAQAAGARRDEAADRLQQRRLAAARRPEQHEAVAAVHVEADVVRGAHDALRRRVFERDALARSSGALRHDLEREDVRSWPQLPDASAGCSKK